MDTGKRERIFGAWLEWSSDAEVLALLDLVMGALRGRGYRVVCEVEPAPERD